ncbi:MULTISPECIES: LLM class flavin-dependent oxidoreductase [Enterobacteriaceae]|uniref:LLM class flavin-dependent oxidoreductase n=1 Tax=Raoultella lignicola TaxID=3040939 RepID=A0ABU9F2X8_9ENTR|nr:MULTISPECIES: LLM class flavin-dependent oxidoreductase [Enterobacteriaceae]MRT50811.1 NtaA/DmoA family FMN-dependent monooxygenase [Raoultella sp. RIT712]QNK08504.1 LLM class flavin-dependent oxidoreductase [Enterobacter sp. JUb54]ROS16279.1 FMN-dependent oxidoreductase (nitrilotriacetate monooxygenase family) [Raoultella sp. BIGb0399]
MSTEHMILNLFFFNPQGDYRFSWRHPQAPTTEIFSLDYYVGLAKKAEAATLDAIFVADHIAIWDKVPSGLTHYANARLEPITLLSALAAVTEHIGLMGTASTSYNEPYNLARYFASLDFLSNGRASWNVVTSWLEEEAANFGLDQLPQHGNRYRRAGEFIDVVTRLWDSWEQDAVLYDKASGLFADKQKVHHLDHRGEHFTVRGPLNLPRPPQGHPVLVQAGSSEAGKDLAATWSDMHFVFIQSIEEGLSYREQMNQRLRAKGRDPAHFKIIAGVLPVVVNSEAEKTQRQQLNNRLMSDRMAIDLLSSYLRMDLSDYAVDQPLPPLPDEETFDGIRTALRLIRHYDPSLTILQLGRLLLQSSDSWLLIGSAEEVASALTETWRAGAADGFNLMFPLLPGDFDRFVELVVPILQRNGVMRTSYPPGTLREKLGLPPAENRFIHHPPPADPR